MLDFDVGIIYLPCEEYMRSYMLGLYIHPDYHDI